MLGLRQVRLGRVVPLEHRGVRAWCKQVRCRCCTSSCRWPCAYAEGWEREMVTASSFVPGESVTEHCLSGKCSEMST